MHHWSLVVLNAHIPKFLQVFCDVDLMVRLPDRERSIQGALPPIAPPIAAVGRDNDQWHTAHTTPAMRKWTSRSSRSSIRAQALPTARDNVLPPLKRPEYRPCPSARTIMSVKSSNHDIMLHPDEIPLQYPMRCGSGCYANPIHSALVYVSHNYVRVLPPVYFH